MRSGADPTGASGRDEYDQQTNYHDPPSYRGYPDASSAELDSYSGAMTPRPLPPTTPRPALEALIEKRLRRLLLNMEVDIAYEAHARATLRMQQWKAGDEETEHQQSRIREALVQGLEVSVKSEAEGRRPGGYSEEWTINHNYRPGNGRS
jgi:hypothetical protein